MALPNLKLTKATVDRVIRQHESGRAEYFDTEISGFLLRVSDREAIYFYRYRKGGGRSASRPRVRIGRHGEITAQEARAAARDYAAIVARGGDPAGAMAERRAAPTVADLMARYLTDHAGMKKKPKSALSDRQMIDRAINPKLGKKKVAEVTHGDIERLHNARRATPYDANRMLALLSKAFGLAEKWGMRPQHSNPCVSVEKFKEHKRERVLSADEIAHLARALDLAATGSIPDVEGKAHRVSPYAVWAIRLLYFTGARKDEILSLRWDHVDFERAQLELPDSKTGAKVIRLNRAALEILAQIPRDEGRAGKPGNPFVIVGAKPGAPLVNISKAWGHIRAHAGISDVRLHDLRHNFGTFGASHGLSNPMVGKLLGHSQPATTQRYMKFQDDPLRAANEQVGQALADALRPDAPGAGKVVPFKGR